jgi:hypothetical protein
MQIARKAERTAAGARSRKDRSRSGQAILESALVIVLISLLAFGVIQLAQLYVARSVLTASAAAGARARSVGFNRFMVLKVARAAAIPTAGALEHPVVPRDPALAALWGTRSPGTLWNVALHGGGGVSPQAAVEIALIPHYLEADHAGRLNAILRYERWPDLQVQESLPSGRLVGVRVEQEVPLVFPFHRAFTADDSVRIRSGDPDQSHFITRGDHAEFYLE